MWRHFKTTQKWVNYLLEPWCGKNLALVVPDEVFPAVVCCCCCCPDDDEGTGPLEPPDPDAGLLDGLDCGFGLSAIDVILTDFQLENNLKLLSLLLFLLFFVLSRANNADLFSTGRFISKAKKFSQLFFASAYILQAPRNFKTWQEGSLAFAVVVLFSSNLVLSQS